MVNFNGFMMWHNINFIKYSYDSKCNYCEKLKTISKNLLWLVLSERQISIAAVAFKDKKRHDTVTLDPSDKVLNQIFRKIKKSLRNDSVKHKSSRTLSTTAKKLEGTLWHNISKYFFLRSRRHNF